MRAMFDSFSGALADLPKGKRDTVSALRVLDKHPRVSVWDLSEHGWLGDLVTDLLLAGLIEDDKRVPHPWHHFTLTDTGRGKLAANDQIQRAPKASAAMPG